MNATEVLAQCRVSVRVTLAAILLVAGHVYAAPMPSYLVGVWAADGATLDGQLLSTGEALYLRADGVGAIVGGPPPIGAKVFASFDPSSGTVLLDILEHNNVVGHGAARYDAATATISFGDPKHALFRRRSEEVSDATSKALGL